MAEDDSCYPGKLFTSRWAERKLARVKKNVGHVDDQTARSIASLKDQVELLEQLRTQGRLLGFRFQPKLIGRLRGETRCHARGFRFGLFCTSLIGVGFCR